MSHEGSVQLEVILEVDHPEQEAAFVAWAAQQRLDVDALDNSGCGCCVDIFSLKVSAQAARQLDEMLRPVGGVDIVADER